ncbi:MAG: glutamate synthase-related protein [Candidatus Saccharibacteria bacterium]|nr:glutamate synthase-related protein [Candidatus Saccharibacteria bacterium]
MVYRCKMCGHIYDDAIEKVKFVDLPDDWVCPICKVPKSMFEVIGGNESGTKPVTISTTDSTAFIQEIVKSGSDVIEPAGAQINVTDWSKLLLLGAQLAIKPLEVTNVVDMQTVIGASAKKPMILGSPIIVSHMSYGALSADQKAAIAKAASSIGAAVGSGEGGICEDEIENAHKFIFEYIPNRYSDTDENLQRVDAIEIKIGQSAKPGLGGHLPAAKVTPEIATARGRKVGEDIISPSSFAEVKKPADLKVLVDSLRQRSDGRPIGIKIAANRIEQDIQWIVESGADFMTIDGRGGGTGAAPKIWRDTAGVPTLFALVRARKALDAAKSDMQLIVTGGLRTASDFAKCLALGADAVAVSTSILTALATQCSLTNQQKVANYLRVSHEQMQLMARAMGRSDIHQLSIEDVVTTDVAIAQFTPIKHVGEV